MEILSIIHPSPIGNELRKLVLISHADILTLFSNPLILLPQPGPSEFTSIGEKSSIYYTSEGVAYATNTNFYLRHVGANTPSNSGILNQTSDKFIGFSNGSIDMAINAAFEIVAQTGNPTAGDPANSLLVDLYYTILPSPKST